MKHWFGLLFLIFGLAQAGMFSYYYLNSANGGWFVALACSAFPFVLGLSMFQILTETDNKNGSGVRE
jgi:hypothetical protein